VNKKILAFSIIFIVSLTSLLFLYSYSLENATYYWNVDDGSGNVYTPVEYLANNPEKFNGKDVYFGGYVELNGSKFFISYASIFPAKDKIRTEIVNSEKFNITCGKHYGFKGKIKNIKTEGDVKVIEMDADNSVYQQLIDMPFVMFEILFNVPAIIIMLYLLLKLKLNFRKFLIEAKT